MPDLVAHIICLSVAAWSLFLLLAFEQIIKSSLSAREKILRIAGLIIATPVGLLVHLESPPRFVGA